MRGFCFWAIVGYNQQMIELTRMDKRSGVLYPYIYVVLFCFSQLILAKDFSSSQQNVLSVELMSQVVQGTATEYVFWGGSSGHKASELIWSIDNVPLYGIDIGYVVRDRFRISLKWAETISDRDSVMDDFDWVDSWSDPDNILATEEWTHWSHHDDTRLTKGSIAELTGEILHPINRGLYLGFIVGVTRDFWSWDAYGGSYIYSQDGFRDISGNFDSDELLISYQQEFITPYIGVGIYQNYGRFHFSGKISGSGLVIGKAIDHHYARALKTVDRFLLGRMLRLELYTAYELGRQLSLQTALNYQKYDLMVGDTEWTEDGVMTTYANGAGADLEYLTLTFGFGVKF